MLTWLLILFVVALALAPLSNFVPSKRQRQVAKMREQAAVSGLFVEFRNPPGTTAPGQSRPPRGGVIYYGKRLPAVLADGVSPAAWVRREDGWHSVRKRVIAPAALADLPQQIGAASIDHNSCGIYWEEGVAPAEAEAVVAQICSVLETWSSAPSG